MPTHTSPAASKLRALAQALGAEEWEGEDDWIEFEVAGVPVIVELIDQIERYRIEVIFAAGGEGEIQSWIDSLNRPRFDAAPV